MNFSVLLSPEYLEINHKYDLLVKETHEIKAHYDLLHSKYTALVEESNQRHEQLVKENEVLDLENKQILAMVQEVKELLALKISENKILRKRIYGSSSEKIDPAALKAKLEKKTETETETPTDSDLESETESINLDSKEEDTNPEQKKKKKYVPRRNRDNLRQETEFVPVIETHCPDCKEELKVIGNEESQKLGFYLQEITKITLSRQKKHCTCCNKFIIGEIPAKFGVLPQALPSSELLTQIAISKCIDHLPWYRQENIFSRSLVGLSRQSMCDWMMSLGKVVTPLYQLICKTILEQYYLQGDEVVIPLKIGNRKHRRTLQRYMWSVLSPELKMVFFKFGDRSSKMAAEAYKEFKGFLQTDCYAGYNILLNVLRLACLAHCRRKFIEAGESMAQFEVLNVFQDIYQIEKEIKGLDSKLRQEVRNTKTRAKFAELKVLLERIVSESIETKSKIIQACHYSLNQWEDIERILEDERFFLDNNNVEQKNRPVALGRKNWLFVCSQLGGDTLAIICTILHSAQLCGLNIFEYFNDVITRIADHPISRLDELMPCNWVAPKITTSNST